VLVKRKRHKTESEAMERTSEKKEKKELKNESNQAVGGQGTRAPYSKGEHAS
jgi:hypothetical protein